MLKLRDLRESDREMYLKAGSCEPGCEKLLTDELIANTMWSLAFGGKGKRKIYVIENIECDFLGYCSIESGITPEIGICLLQSFQGKGLGVVAIRLLWEEICKERNLEYFVARVEKSNVYSIKMFEKLGAKVMENEESSLLLNLRKIAEEDKKYASILSEMQEFSNEIVQFAISF